MRECQAFFAAATAPPLDAHTASQTCSSHSKPLDSASSRGLPRLMASTYSGSWTVSIVAWLRGDGSINTTPGMGHCRNDVATHVALRVVSKSQAEVVYAGA